MGLSYDYDCASSILLCSEDKTTIFDDEEVAEEVVGSHGQRLTWSPEPKSSTLCDDPFMSSFPLQSDHCLGLLVEREADHLPAIGYAERLQTGALDPSIRRAAIDWIGKVHAHFGFGPLSACLAVNYLDRFLAAYELPEGKDWMTQLLSVACLSLAAKMEEVEIPHSLDLQVGEARFVFEGRTIQRMELLVLSKLKWRMQAVTPFAFIDYFLQEFSDGSFPTKALIQRSAEIILSMIRGIDFLEFRPSEIAAAVALLVLEESQMVNAVTCWEYVEKERVLKCYKVIQEIGLMSRPLRDVSAPVSSEPMSPNGVLDAACLSYNSDDTTFSAQANSYPSPAIKRRKISKPSIY